MRCGDELLRGGNDGVDLGNDELLQRAERRIEGMAKVVVTPGGRILGAGIVGAQAGELIQTWVLAMRQRLAVGALAAMIAPYPTLGEINKRVAGAFYTDRLFGSTTRRIVRLLAHFG